MLSTKLKVANYKCFAAEPQGFDRTGRLNIIVGRNNSGKSTLLDIVEMATGQQQSFRLQDEALKHSTISEPEIHIGTTITADEIAVRYSSQSTSNVGNHAEYGRQFIGCDLTVKVHLTGVALADIRNRENQSVREKFEAIGEYAILTNDWQRRNPWAGSAYYRLASERDIIPETSVSGRLQPDGAGATYLLYEYLNTAAYPQELVHSDLLNALNDIFSPDTIFKRIYVKKNLEDAWEVFLEERSKNLVALSKSGSGLKTVFLVLLAILILPHKENRDVSNYVFSFEELENNIHPSLQRRLISYIAREAKSRDFVAFLTTHSHVVIDIANKISETVIVHVTHDGEKASVSPVKAHIERGKILDDLDVRASDLLQANGVIWVEGPSDRTYLSKWINLWSDGNFEEGLHYQIVFYGGRLLSHLEATTSKTSLDAGVAILKVNRNACVLIDSDKRLETAAINDTKKRVAKEVSAVGGFSWVTAGREIENYLPAPVFSRVAGFERVSEQQIGRYASVFDVIESVTKRDWRKDKVGLASRVCDVITKDDLVAYDIANCLQRLCAQISRWNQFPEPKPPAV